jgi:hypothetical protein
MNDMVAKSKVELALRSQFHLFSCSLVSQGKSMGTRTVIERMGSSGTPVRGVEVI